MEDKILSSIRNFFRSAATTPKNNNNNNNNNKKEEEVKQTAYFGLTSKRKLSIFESFGPVEQANANKASNNKTRYTITKSPSFTKSLFKIFSRVEL